MIVNQNTNYSSCALSVRTGSFDDTKPGIAHLLEHMIYNGASLCNNAYYFKNFLALHNGFANAETRDDVTTFYFDIYFNHFTDALKLFADCFKTPNFDLQAIKNEVNSVDNEFISKYVVEGNRSEQLRKFFSKEPFNNFLWGNKQTLLDSDIFDDEQKYKTLQEEVIKFWKENYDSKTMKLVVYHHKNILNSICTLFEKIPFIPNKKTLPIIEIDRYNNNFIRQLYKPEFTNKYIYVKPITNESTIHINIEIPNVKFAFKNNMLKYFKYILLSWQKGTLLNQYEQMELSTYFHFKIKNTLYVRYFIIEISITDSGLNEIEKIISMFYKYLYNLNYSNKEYNLYKKKLQKNFKYKKSIASVDEIKTLATNMQYYPIKNILNYDHIFENFNKFEMEGLLDIIKNFDNWLVFIISKKYFRDKQKAKTEEFFETEYIVSDKLVIEQKYQSKDNNQNIISPRIYLLHKIGQSLPFKLPTNKYYLKNNIDLGLISFLKNTLYNKTNSLVYKLKDKSNQIKLIEKEKEGGKFTFIYNPTYNIPKSYVSIKFNTEITRENYIIFSIYLEMVIQTYSEKYQEYDFYGST